MLIYKKNNVNLISTSDLAVDNCLAIKAKRSALNK